MTFQSPQFDRPLAGLVRGWQRSRVGFLILLIVVYMVISADCVMEKMEAQKKGNTENGRYETRRMAPVTSVGPEAIRIGRRGVVTFTGNAPEDFIDGAVMIQDDGNRISGTELGGFFETTDVGQFGVLARSGMDIRRVYWKYDMNEDVMYVGIDCYGICGDVDGDGNPDQPSPAFSVSNGVDTPALSTPEFLLVGIDVNAPATGTAILPEFLIGSNLRPPGSISQYSNFSILSASTPLLFPYSSSLLSNYFNQSNFTTLPSSNTLPSLSGLVDPNIYFRSHSNNSSFGDIEFAINRFSLLPGLSWNATGSTTPSTEPGYGKLSFSFIVTLGTTASSYPFTDVVPNRSISAGTSLGHRLIFECPFLPLDPLGNCCPLPSRDFCGVCNGNNANLDPCGSCRLNASMVPASSCPGAVSSWSSISTTASFYYSDTSYASADINGDGIQDVIIGLPTLNQVLIRFLDLTGQDTSVVTISNPNTIDSSNDEFGFSLSASGDINNDGTIDLFIGAPGYANGTGIVYVAILRPTGNVSRWNMIEHEQRATPLATSCAPLSTLRKDSSDAFSPSPTAPPDQFMPNLSPMEENSAPAPCPSPSLPFAPRFGHSISYLGRNLLLVAAPKSQLNDTSTLYSQSGALMLVGLATDGSSIGMYTLSTKLINGSAINAGLYEDIISNSTLGRLTHLAGTVQSNGQQTYRIITSIDWSTRFRSSITTMMMLIVKTDGSIPFKRHLVIPDIPFPLPNFPSSPPLSGAPLYPPNYIPTDISSRIASLAGAGDIDGDGYPDMILGVHSYNPQSADLLLVCFIGPDGQVLRTQLIGAGGLGHFMYRTVPSYQFGSFIHVSPSMLPIGGLVPAPGSVTVLLSAISPNGPMKFFALNLWGTSAPPSPSPPSSPQAPFSAPTINGGPPAGLAPGSIIEPNPAFPLAPAVDTDSVVLQFVSDSPKLKISSTMMENIWTTISLDKIVERPSQAPYGPLKTLYPPGPTAWSKQVSTDKMETTFSAKMTNSNGSPSNVDLQVQVITFTSPRTVVFAPSSYLGVTEKSIKFSFLVRGWTFTQSKTVLDLHISVANNNPIIAVTTDSSSEPGSERFTRFNLTSITSSTLIKIPSFATIDGVLTNLSPPTFNQTSSELILTAPPFFDTLFYDPDVTIKATNPSKGIKKMSPQRYLLVIIIIASIIGLILLTGLIFCLTVCACRQMKAEKRWKDAGEVSTV